MRLVFLDVIRLRSNGKDSRKLRPSLHEMRATEDSDIRGHLIILTPVLRIYYGVVESEANTSSRFSLCE